MCVIADRRFTYGVEGPFSQDCHPGRESKMIIEVEAAGKLQHRG